MTDTTSPMSFFHYPTKVITTQPQQTVAGNAAASQQMPPATNPSSITSPPGNNYNPPPPTGTGVGAMNPYQPGKMMGAGAPMMGMQHMVQNFMTPPNPGVPPGLEVLHFTDHLFVRQSIEPMEFMYNAANKYEVLDNYGRRIFFAVETTTFMERNCVCCGAFPLKMSVLNFAGQEVLFMNGNTGACYDGILNIGQKGTSFGSVQQNFSCCAEEFQVLDRNGGRVFQIIGPAQLFSCTCGTIHFDVLLHGQNTVVGQISKQWSGLGQEMFTTADNYGISFPQNTDVMMKVVLLGACLLIDFKLFENKHDDNDM